MQRSWHNTLMVASTKVRLIAVALFASVAGFGVMRAAPAPEKQPATDAKKTPSAAAKNTSATDGKKTPATEAREKAKRTTTVAPNQQELLKQLNTQRDQMIAEQDDLQKQYKAATEEKRKEILKKIQDRQKQFEETLAALHKQIRDEQRKQRQHPDPKR